VTWKKVVNGGEPRLRGCIGTLEARWLINGFKDYALNRYFQRKKKCSFLLNYIGIVYSGTCTSHSCPPTPTPTPKKKKKMFVVKSCYSVWHTQYVYLCIFIFLAIESILVLMR
jgi:hypothetical protein